MKPGDRVQLKKNEYIGIDNSADRFMHKGDRGEITNWLPGWSGVVKVRFDAIGNQPAITGAVAESALKVLEEKRAEPERHPATPFLNTHGCPNGIALAEILQIETDKMFDALESILKSPNRTVLDYIVIEHLLTQQISAHMGTLRVRMAADEYRARRAARVNSERASSKEQPGIPG